MDVRGVDRRYARPLETLAVDAELFNAAFPVEFRREVAARIKAIVPQYPGMNAEFFGAAGTYGNRHSVLTGIENLDDLFAPNIAVLDYAAKHLDCHATVIADYGCGLGVGALYLTWLGFWVSGCDDWSQLPRLAADEFLSHYAVRPRIADRISRLANVLVHCGIKVTDEIPDSVQVILSDSNYAPYNYGGFETVARYPSLLEVHRRVGNSHHVKDRR